MSAKNEHEKNCVLLCTTFILFKIQKRACENENKLLFISYSIFFWYGKRFQEEIKFSNSL
jgi:hypothetical protein